CSAWDSSLSTHVF
nr:immunoglobulin light chain junction region [Macaca mulatta]MPO07369.1 immunoglobulin light chain junction region [Macaca mulatta]MPO07716.1 immunoglobulin light chain junction region [Macaca mulatta]MPO10491.1 immunoglobulin light chain junction region [Macaca mulatta]MPO11141.1 immunoglobulin light chain junction region [Macaca mulatta]